MAVLLSSKIDTHAAFRIGIALDHVAASKHRPALQRRKNGLIESIGIRSVHEQRSLAATEFVAVEFSGVMLPNERITLIGEPVDRVALFLAAVFAVAQLEVDLDAILRFHRRARATKQSLQEAHRSYTRVMSNCAF